MIDTFYYIPNWHSKDRPFYNFRRWIKKNKIKAGRVIICFPWESTWQMYKKNDFNFLVGSYKKIDLVVITNCEIPNFTYLEENLIV